MKLEASPVGESTVGINQIQVQLANLMLQLQDIKKAKEYRDDLWCTCFHADGHTKDTCPMFHNYLLLGALNPLSYAGVPWCHICQVYGHRHENCDYMEKMVTNSENLYCTFCRSVGHDDKKCQAYDLLQERMYDSYFVKGEDPRIVQAQPQVVQLVSQVPYTPPPLLQFVPAQP